MANLIVVDNPDAFHFKVADAQIVAASDYLMQDEWQERKRLRVYNLCQSYQYQRTGYYVSLLAAARGHQPLPSVVTMQDMRYPSLTPLPTEVESLIERSLKDLRSDRFELSIYFGRNMAERHQRLATALYNMRPAPLMRALFELRKHRWRLKRLSAIQLEDIPEAHFEFLQEAIRWHFMRRFSAGSSPRAARYDLAILVNPEDPMPPSDGPALRRFEKAARALGFAVEFIRPEDYGRMAEFDALFIRETTSVSSHTYRFARRAEWEGTVVMDDPLSIMRCANKVYLAEVLQKHAIPTPRTLIISEDNATDVRSLGLPCVLKLPDSSFSKGVIKVEDESELQDGLKAYFAESDLIVAQEYTPTDFDWRVGVLNGEPLYVCRYFMADHHWQIYKRGASGRVTSGSYETLDPAQAPDNVLELACRAARLMGSGLYGVDLKQIGERVVVIEVNDNPNIDSGVEDKVLGIALYERIIRHLYNQVEARGGDE